MTEQKRPIRAACVSFGLTLTLFSATAAQSAEVYRWVDEEGVVNFTQQKPRDVAAQQLVTNAGAPTVVERAVAPDPGVTPPGEEDGRLNASQEAMLEELRAAEAARQAEIAEIRKANCSKSRTVLANLSARGRIRVRNPDGTERLMDEEERQRRISEAQQGIVENCSPT